MASPVEWKVFPADERLETAEGYGVKHGQDIVASGLMSKLCARMVMVELIKLETAQWDARAQKESDMTGMIM